MTESSSDRETIPICDADELIQPALRRYKVGLLDPAIQDLILSDIFESIESNDLERMRMFLSSDTSRWIGNLQWAFFQHFPGQAVLGRYEEWVEAKCALLLAILRQTREEDYVIQHLLNYEDFCIEVLNWPFKNGARFLIQVYELRGIDFFLFHYMGGQTDAHRDAALFDGARTVVRALKEVQRLAEAEQVEREINERRNRVVEIQKSFIGPDYDPASNLAGKLKIASEKFWADYLSVPVWRGLLPDSRSDLTDAFSTEYLLKSQILTNWSNVSLLLCKVVEREVGRVLFLPWKPLFASIERTEPSGLPNNEVRHVQARIQTLRMLKNVAMKARMAPTLGQLVFIAKFWNDSLMDSLTDIFIKVRRQASSRVPLVDGYVEQVAKILTEPIVNGGETKSITDIRNSAAHPRSDANLDWQSFSTTLQEVLGRPPRTLLRLLCVDMAAVTQTEGSSGKIMA